MKMLDLPVELPGGVRAERLLARGQRGDVYAGIWVEKQKPVAIKVLARGLAKSDPERLKNESRILSSVQSPNLGAVFFTGKTQSDHLFRVMELVEGVGLDRLLQFSELLTLPRTVHIGLQIARGLHAAHQVGVIHRGLKPSNVMLTQKGDDPFFVKLLDFGLTQTFNQINAPITGMGIGAIDAPYLTPEQIQGDAIDVRTDVYAFGNLLYLLTTLIQPFAHSDPHKQIRAVLKDLPQAPHLRNPGRKIPAGLSAVIMRCLEKDPIRRPATIEEVAQALTSSGMQAPQKCTPRENEILAQAADPNALEQTQPIVAVAHSSISDGEILRDLALSPPLPTARSFGFDAKTDFDKSALSGTGSSIPQTDPTVNSPFTGPTLSLKRPPEFSLSSPSTEERGRLTTTATTQKDSPKTQDNSDTAFDARPYQSAGTLEDNLPTEQNEPSVQDAHGDGVAIRLSDQKTVAVKRLTGDADESLTKRFSREARTLAGLDNAHLVKMLDMGQDEAGRPHLVMEFLDGVTLGHLLHYPEVLTIPRIVHIALQISRGLHAAHHAGVIHRDLSPGNIILVEKAGNPFFTKVVDFGIAKPLVPTAESLTGVGTAYGNLPFMAPEQIRGDEVDVRTDIWGLGALLFTMCTRTLPFEFQDPAHTARAILKDQVESPAERAPGLDIPEGLSHLVLRCLGKKREDRPPSMEAMGEALLALEVPEPQNPSDYVKEVLGHAKSHFFSDGLSTSPIPILTSSQDETGTMGGTDKHTFPRDLTENGDPWTLPSGESVFASSPLLAPQGPMDPAVAAVADDEAKSPFDGDSAVVSRGDEAEVATQIKNLPSELADAIETAADSAPIQPGTQSTGELATEVPENTQLDSGPTSPERKKGN
jgi:serine/threonine-protein kinase